MRGPSARVGPPTWTRRLRRVPALAGAASLSAALLLFSLCFLVVAPAFDPHLAERAPHLHVVPREDFRPHRHAYELPRVERMGTASTDASGADRPEGLALSPLDTMFVSIIVIGIALWLTVPSAPSAPSSARALLATVRVMPRPLLATRADRPPLGQSS